MTNDCKRGDAKTTTRMVSERNDDAVFELKEAFKNGAYE